MTIDLENCGCMKPTTINKTARFRPKQKSVDQTFTSIHEAINVKEMRMRC
jgi:hypothetical protein